MNFKKYVLAFVIGILLLFSGCRETISTEQSKEKVSQNVDNEISLQLLGKWECELYSSSKVIEFTDDGRFISYNDKGLYIDYNSYDVSNYRIENGNIVTFVEGFEESSIALPFSIKDNILTYGAIEYRKVED